MKQLEEKSQLGKLQDMTWVSLDSGGQPQFHEPFSTFVRNALVGIFIHKLSKNLMITLMSNTLTKKVNSLAQDTVLPLATELSFNNAFRQCSKLSIPQ